MSKDKRLSDQQEAARIAAVLKALEGFSITEVQEIARTGKRTDSKSKVNGIFKDALLKVLSSRKVESAY